MNYFVSIDNTFYFHWQIELLIQSFKLLGIEDQLCIAIAENDGLSAQSHVKNLMLHENKFIHDNYGKENGFLPLNKFYSLLVAIKCNYLTPPVAIIHPDMVLLKPIEEEDEDICFHPDEDIFDNTKVIIEDYLNQLTEESKLPDIPVGNVFVLKSLNEDFALRALQHAHVFNEEKAAWTAAFYDFLDKFSYRGVIYESTLLHDNVDTNIIHYGNGLPPDFTKKFFTANSINIVSQGPFETLSQLDYSTNLKKINQIIKSY